MEKIEINGKKVYRDVAIDMANALMDNVEALREKANQFRNRGAHSTASDYDRKADQMKEAMLDLFGEVIDTDSFINL